MLELFDYVIKNGKNVDESPIEVGIKEGKIVAIAPVIEHAASHTLDLFGQAYISAGWIDAHTHCYEKMSLYYDNPDEIGIKKGVTTVIDAGTTGAENIGDFYQLSKQAKTNVYALLNIAESGIVSQNELADLSKIKQEFVQQALAFYPSFIVGLKARMSRSVVGHNNLEPLRLAKKIQHQFSNLPLMVHIGSAPPLLSDILALLEKGDIVTHCFNGKENGVLDNTGNIYEYVWQAYRNGVAFDVGHGTDSFNFSVAKSAISQGFIPETVSTDIYARNRINGPVYDLATMLEKMRVLGFSWSEILPMITSHPAQLFHLEKKGHLAVGYDADLTIFTIHKGEKRLVDSNGNEQMTREIVNPSHTFVAGKLHNIGGDK